MRISYWADGLGMVIGVHLDKLPDLAIYVWSWGMIPLFFFEDTL